MLTINKLQRAIGRSQTAYDLYIVEKRYFQALRIKRANLHVYEILETYLYECDEDEIEMVHQFIYHLEDWFNQFEELEKTAPELEAPFIFQRMKDSPEFPKSFIDKILSKEI